MRRRLLAALITVVFGLAGCGIPDQTEVRVDGRGPVGNRSSTGGTSQPPPGRLDSGDDVERFAENFLKAAAGEAGEAYKRVNDYILAPRRFPEKPVAEFGVNVVRLVESSPFTTLNGDGTSSVTVKVQQVGVLRTNGSVGEPVATETEYQFTVGREPVEPGPAVPSSGLYVLEPPPVLLLSTDALETYYEARTIYFWNADRESLVPDLRYLPWSVPVQRQATVVLEWLISGPASWLTPTAAVRLPDGTANAGNVPEPKDGGALEVPLSVKAGEVETDQDRDQLFMQLVWSLRENPLLRNELELRIQNQVNVVHDAADYRGKHPVYQVRGNPDRYCVYAGGVRALAGSGGNQPVPVTAEANRDVVSAAVSRGDLEVRVALVTASGEDYRLRVGVGVGVVSTFKASRPYASMGRPVWLKEADPRDPIGLVVADGGLYQFGAAGVLTQVRLPNVSGPVTAVGAALDGHRIAFIAGGALYVAALAGNGGTLSVGPARRLSTSLRDLTAVDWYGENSVVVAGANTDRRPAIYQMSVDGVRESPVVPDVGAKVVHLSVYPDNPVVPASIGSAMYEANAVVYATGVRISQNQVVIGGPVAEGSGRLSAPFFGY